MRHPRGFTLIEILAALAVLGLVIAMLGQGLRFGLNAASLRDRTRDQAAEMEAAARTIRGLIENAAPARELSPAPFQGTPSRMELRSALPLAGGSPAARRADVLLAVDSQQRLVLRWVPYLHAVRFGPPPPAQESILASGVAQLAIQYWGKPNDKSPPGWFSGWAGAGPPALIRVQVVFPPGSHRHWPDIVAAPRAEAARE